MALDDFRERFYSVDLCRVKNGQLKEGTVLKATEKSDADADTSVPEDDWLAGIDGAERAHHAPKAKKKSKKKHKHKR